jgi:multiple sugar transport system permease protein
MRETRFGKYFTRYGWAHALLLLAAWMFLFPFIWMFATSVKTDEELIEPGILPSVEHFKPSSPYVRSAPDLIRPADVTSERWDQMIPKLKQIASDEIAKYQNAHSAPPAIEPIDAAAYRESGSAALVNTLVAKLDRRLWTGDDATLIDAYKSFLDQKSIEDALSDSLARIELISFQIRTLDLHIFTLTDGTDFPAKWTVESGNAKLLPTGNVTRLSYRFDSSSSDPVVLRYNFCLPPGVEPENLHKLNLTVLSDNSWHRVDCTFDCEGKRWQSDECVYLAQYRPMSLLFQPPTFDDELMRAKVWTTIKPIGPSPEKELRPLLITENKGDVALFSQQGAPAVLRITLSPSSTLRANWGKLWRNYDKAFKSVPFWRYITNSILLVVLITVGSLFSASFVAYAFARLNWPGRSIAFLLLLATMMLPSQVTMIPGFLIWKSLHWYNTLNPLWVPAFFGSAFFIFLMTQHMRTIPRELEEAARLDGLNAVQSWYYIILPNVKPTLAAIAILSFIGAWNEFMAPLIYLRDQTKFPLSLGLYGLGLLNKTNAADYSWSVIMAGNMLMTVPVIVVFFLFQRYFVQGMTLTGMKG